MGNLLRNYLGQMKAGKKIQYRDVLGWDYGNVYFAVQSDASYYTTFVKDHLCKYSDGTQSIYNTIQAAVNASSSTRPDIVVVMPDKWVEQVVIYAKKALTIRAAVRGWETQMRPSDAVTKYPWTPAGTPAGALTGGATFFVLSRSVTLEGFLFDGGGGYSGVYVGDGDVVAGLAYTNQNAASCIIRDCDFFGNAGHYGVDLEGCGNHFLVEDCSFEGWTKDAIRVGSYSSRSNQQPTIRHNRFYAANAAYGVTVISIAGGNKGVNIEENSFRDGPSAVFTAAVNSLTDQVTGIVGNKFACAVPIIAQGTDYVSGNTYFGAGNATPASNIFTTQDAAGAD